MVVGFSAGGATDTVARAIGQNLHKAFGQPVIVENRPGAASNIAADHVAKSPPDGYTLLMGSISLGNNATLYTNLPYDALHDLAPIVHVTDTPFMLCVHPSIPVTSVKDAGRLRRGAFGSSAIRDSRQRLRCTPLHRALRQHGRHQDAGDPLQRRRAGDQRSGRRAARVRIR
jgi:hypothetical protein